MIVSTGLVTTSRAGVNLLLLFKYPNTNYFVVPYDLFLILSRRSMLNITYMAHTIL